MENQTQYIFTRQQYDSLNNEQKKAIDAVAEYLNGNPFPGETDLTDESISEALNLLKPCDGCVPPEEAEDVHNAIRRKFAAIYQVSIDLAEQQLRRRGLHLRINSTSA